VKGDAIELDPANAQKIAAVVAGLRRQAAVKPPTYDHLQNRVANIEKRFFAILDEIDRILRTGEENADQFTLAVGRMSAALSRLIKDNSL